MSKKKADTIVYRRTGIEVTLDAMRYAHNGFGCGHGAHVNKKRYSRKNKSWRKEL